ncbi:uncharacterized protein FA14DRAFT_162559 [Meira miltonrushii]|uniref:Amino acid transporter transmembrane domain-containing protein n=1 Tax=Meira miltonrushii TaxID=1280837 RepID=A0A316V276_9BASI|nr:uncharacterized protein FA14DRAFT_162559 [Meira miltonrushii]PWN31562.1 hypothetical protein FA14DRAFT_162559 [Meira miltonrushii]
MSTEEKRSPDEIQSELPKYELTTEEQVVNAAFGGASARGATLEDCMYYADQQYYCNDTTPLEAFTKEPTGKGNLVRRLFKRKNDAVESSASSQAVVEKIDEFPGPEIKKGPLRFIWGPSSPPLQIAPQDEKAQHENAVVHADDLDPDDERNQDTMDRLILRQITWMRCVYLITSDVLGPYQGPYVYSQVGYVPGTIVYVVMGLMAYLAGCILSVLYLRTDSDRMPVRSFGSLVGRVWGFWGKAVTDVFFIIQLIFQCGLLLLTNSQGLGMIIDGSGTNPDGSPKHHLCFSVMIVVFLAINIGFSFIRSLKPIAKMGTLSLYLAIASVIIITVFIYISPPNYAAALQAFGTPKGPVVTGAFISLPIAAKVNGIMNMVYAFGGSMVFPNFFAEMRKPWDFYKSYFVAQVIIMIFYILFGILIYARQGQFTQSLFYFGVSEYSYQTVGNAIGTYTGVVAAILYGNIAQKELYQIIVRRLFKGPRLMSNKALPFYTIINVVFWGIAYNIGAAIPQVQTVSGIIGAVTILQFSFTFPFLLKFTFDVQVDAMKGDLPYVPGTMGRVQHRADTWSQWSRWRRGLFGGNVYSKAVFLILGLASASMAGLGIYGSLESIITTFASPQTTKPYGCATP